MTEPGKYSKQRLKVKEVLRLYAAGERDFRGTILRGCNFHGANLSGADFTGADIRSAQFVNTILRETQFIFVKAGLQKRWAFIQIILLTLLAVSAGTIHAFTFILIYNFLGSFAAITANKFEISYLILLIIYAISQILLEKPTQTKQHVNAFYVLGFLYTGLPSILVSILLASILNSSFYFLIFAIYGMVFYIVGNIIFPSIFFHFSAGVMGLYGYTFGIAVANIFVFFSIITIQEYIAIPPRSSKIPLYSVNKFFSGSTERFFCMALSFFSIGGTCFDGSDLSKANFNGGNLGNASFVNSRKNKISLHQIRWKDVKNLDHANFDKESNLKSYRIRRLLVTLDGKDQDFSKADLKGVDLDGVTLHRIDLKEADLSNSTLRFAEMHEANLSRACLRAANLRQADLSATQCVGTDFSRADLTGACLEAWNIYETTNFDNLKCDYVFLKAKPNQLGVRERLPHDPDKILEDGDFEKYFREVINEVKLLIRGGINIASIKAALNELKQKFDIVERAISVFRTKDEEYAILTAQVSESQNKGEIEHTFDAAIYKEYIKAVEAAHLAGKRSDDMEKIEFSLLAEPRSSIQIINMNSSINAGDGGVINMGSMEGSVVNLGAISGQVSVQINQLPDTTASVNQHNLKDLLTQLKAAVDDDSELSDDEKAEALGEVAKLAKAGKNPQENAMQRMAKRATDALKSIAEPLSEASKLATVCKSLLPMILTLF